MASETKIGQLVIDLKMKVEALEKASETAQKKLKEIENENQNLQNSNKGLDASFVVMAVGIVASLNKIKGAVTSGIDKYKEYESANKGLESIVKGQGLSFNKAKSFIEDYISDGLIPLSDATLAYKNLAARGYNEDQIKKTMLALKDAAAFGRQSTYEYGQAIATATEGLKNENSVLVDNAGVTKNVAKMWEDYAQTIGKTASSLTQEEKILAEVNGIVEESKYQVGDAAKYAETYAGQQAQLNAKTIELQKTFGEALIPTMTDLSTIQGQLVQGLIDFIENNKSATSGIVTFTAVFGSLTLALKIGSTAMTKFKESTIAATIASDGLKAAIEANPLFFAAMAIITGISLITSAFEAHNAEQQEYIKKTEEAIKRTEELTEAMAHFSETSSYTESEQSLVEDEVKKCEEIVKTYEELKNSVDSIEQEMLEMVQRGELARLSTYQLTATAMRATMESFKEEYLSGGKSVEFYNNKIATLNKTLELNKAKQDYLTKTNIKSHRETLVNIAQTKADIKGKQELLDVLKKGETSTDAYANAKKQLIKVYPELATVNENTIASTQGMIDAEDRAAQAEWALAQATIMNSIAELTAMQNNDALVQQIAIATRQKVEDVRASIEAATASLMELSKLSVSDLSGSVTTNYTPYVPRSSGGGGSSSSSKSYSNKALDNYKKQIEHKKALDQLSLKEEIAMYDYALKHYTKTQDEKWELQEKLYDLNKEMAQKEKELLDQQTEDFEAYVQSQINNRGAEYDIKKKTRDYNQIIETHRNYLNQIMKDERLSLDERKQIYREELQTIRDYQQRIRDLRVETVDSAVTYLTNAITRQLEELQQKDIDAVNSQIKRIEEWKDASINAINEEYNARIDAIDKELKALDKAEQERTREEEDAEYERKRKRLEDLISFEHDATTKANYQKELNKLLEEYQKTLDARALEDRKKALNEQKELLKEEQDNKVKNIEEQTEAEREILNNQLSDLEEYYSKQIDMAQETAEKMLINTEQNQKQILNLLKNYGNAYEITGQSLGEKLAQGINDGILNRITNIVQNIQDTIDKGIENKISDWNKELYKYEAGTGKPQTTNNNYTINQNNYIEQNPEMPSETYRKLRNIDEELAALLVGG